MGFESLLEQVEPKLKAIAYNLNYKCSYFDADDLYQEAVIDLWIKYGRNELSDKTDSYILQGCFFFLKNYIRVAYKTVDARSLHISGMAADQGDEAQEEPFRCEGRGQDLEFVMIDILVEDILKCLTEREGKVFLMSIDEHTTREIGAEIGVSHPMVVKIEKRIREKCEAFRREMVAC